MAYPSLEVILKVAIATFAVTFPLAQSHSTFIRIALNDEWQDPLRYIRNKTSPYDDIAITVDYPSTLRLYHYPTWPIDHPESVRCGRDHMSHASSTEILTVQAGDTIAFAHQLYDPFEWTIAQFIDCPQGRGTCDDKGYTMGLFHDGPVVAHLSKVPEGQDVHTYDGAGEWVKIYTIGVRTRGPDDFLGPPFLWLPHNDGKLPPKFEFNIPPQTPPGEYLLRIDMIWPGTVMQQYNDTLYAQMYPSCAQIRVESDAFNNTLPKGIRIPEDLSPSSPGMMVSEDMHYGRTIDEDFVYPGGPLWDGERLIVDRPIY
ncbi:glycoside hydrolase [Xylaria sp. FL1777]|nr:glycoside hydrolase [Xylaria sp. FL1777]